MCSSAFSIFASDTVSFKGCEASVPLLLCTAMSFIIVFIGKTDMGVIMGSYKAIWKYLWRVVLVSVMNMVLCAVLTYIFFHRIQKYTKTMQSALLKINSASYDKSSLIPVDLSTEISYTTYMVNQTIILFGSILEQTEQLNNDIQDAAQNLSSISKETASTALSQSTAVKEIVGTMENANALSHSIEVKIEEVNVVANKTSRDVDFGFDVVKQNLSKMQEIISANQTSINGMQLLSSKIKSIWEIVNLIDSVADQTKIIAFNAELEAENVQDGTQKFQNVASNIRSLADSVIALTGQIRSQIQDIQTSSNRLVNQGQDCTNRIEEGNLLTQALEEKFKAIRDSSVMTSSSSEDIKSVIARQAEIFQQLLSRLQQISSGVEQFSTATKSISQTVQELRKNSEHLSSLQINHDSTGDQI